MAQFFPSLDTIRQFKVQPTEGERALLLFLEKVLDDNFEVYFKPFINGDRPDLISLEPRQLSSNLGRVYLLSCEARPYFIVF